MSSGYAALRMSGANATSTASAIPVGLTPSQSPDCKPVIVSSGISEEVCGMIVCFALGFLALLALRPRTIRFALTPAGHPLKQRAWLGQKPALPEEQSQLVKATSLPAAAPSLACAAGLTRLPREIFAEVAGTLELRDFLALGAASVTTQLRFWSAPEAWHTLAAERGVKLNLCSAMTAAPVANELERTRGFREAFRRAAFHVDGELLCQLSSAGPGVRGQGHASVLQEALHMVRGLVPSDGSAAVERLCEIAERALQAHDPANKDGAGAASQFLEVVRCRPDIFDASQVELLEGAYASALQLEEFMEVAMQGHSDQMEMAVNQSQASTPPSSSHSSPRMPVRVHRSVLDTRNAVVRALAEAADRQSRPISRPVCEERSVDAAIEAQRHCELEAMLEELRRQSELHESS